YGTPAVAGMAVVLVDHVDAGDAQGVGHRARVVHVGRRRVAAIEQVDQQRARRAVVAVHLVDERIAVMPAVFVDLAQAGIHPDVAGADVVADGLRRGGRGKSESEGEREDVESAGRDHGGCSVDWDIASLAIDDELQVIRVRSGSGLPRTTGAARSVGRSGYGTRVRVCTASPGRNDVGLPCTQSSWPAPQNGDSGCPLWPPGMCAMPSDSWPGATTMRSDAPKSGAATRGMLPSPASWSGGMHSKRSPSSGIAPVSGWQMCAVLRSPHVR